MIAYFLLVHRYPDLFARKFDAGNGSRILALLERYLSSPAANNYSRQAPAAMLPSYPTKADVVFA
ncbi:MAG: hypothetical protein BGP16_04970 [Sphingobium sp. 66-54]|nr:MAG: hypothetical protein BGP16_04970 [Sphingobium sp. 66-54]